jgi:hypothetical protein
MLATQQMLDAQATRAEAQAEREREWRREDMKIASDNLRTARGGNLAKWGALVVAVVSLGLSAWTLFYSRPIQTALSVVQPLATKPAAIAPTAQLPTKTIPTKPATP